MGKIDPTDQGTIGEGAAAQSMKDLVLDTKPVALGKPIIKIEKDIVMSEDQLTLRQVTIVIETTEDPYHMTEIEVMTHNQLC